MSSHYLKQGDRANPIRTKLKDSNGTLVFDPSDVVRLRAVNRKTKTVLLNDVVCTWVDATVGDIKYDPTEDDVSLPGTYLLEWKVTYAATSKSQRFPNIWYDYLFVEKKL